MKEVFFLRHATASWAAETAFDIDRPLTLEGISETKLIENYALSNDIKIEKVLCSPSKRTKETSDLIFTGFRYDINEVIYKDFLYSGSSKELLSFLELQDDSINSILVIGHNPMLSEIISLLTKTTIDIYEPCTLTSINLKAWSSIHDSKLKFKINPKQCNK